MWTHPVDTRVLRDVLEHVDREGDVELPGVGPRELLQADLVPLVHRPVALDARVGVDADEVAAPVEDRSQGPRQVRTCADVEHPDRLVRVERKQVGDVAKVHARLVVLAELGAGFLLDPRPPSAADIGSLNEQAEVPEDEAIPVSRILRLRQENEAPPGLAIRYIGKHSLFKGPLGWFLRAMGGIPVDRDEIGADVLDLGPCRVL